MSASASGCSCCSPSAAASLLLLLLVFTAVGAPRPLLFGLFVRESLAGLTFAAVLGVVISHVTVLVLNRVLRPADRLEF